MNTLTAFLCQLGLTAAQGAIGKNFFAPKGALSVFGNVGVQVAAQSALTALQYYVATKNSTTDPKGNKLVLVGYAADGTPVYQTPVPPQNQAIPDLETAKGLK